VQPCGSTGLPRTHQTIAKVGLRKRIVLLCRQAIIAQSFNLVFGALQKTPEPYCTLAVEPATSGRGLLLPGVVHLRTRQQFAERCLRAIHAEL
jgi:hypothetical protein